jgi:hypothetical protein
MEKDLNVVSIIFLINIRRIYYYFYYYNWYELLVVGRGINFIFIFYCVYPSGGLRKMDSKLHRLFS